MPKLTSETALAKVVPNFATLVFIVGLLVTSIGTGIAVYVRIGTVANSVVKSHEQKRLDLSHNDAVDKKTHQAKFDKVVDHLKNIQTTIEHQQTTNAVIHQEHKDEIKQIWRSMRNGRRRRTP